MPAKVRLIVALRFALALLPGASDPLNAAAQSPPPAVLTGRVQDESGAPLEAARVVLMPGSRTAFTRADGTFAFTQVAPGTYSIQA